MTNCSLVEHNLNLAEVILFKTDDALDPHSRDMDDDGDDKDDTKRKSRNLSEKKRRDQFNMLVNELSTMVSTNTRKMDKSTVLKSTISFLKNHNEVMLRSRVHEIQEDWKPSFLSNEEFTHLILEALDGFIMVFSSSGRIYYTSESITSLLGHLPSDLLNKMIFELVYEDDRPHLYNLLQNPTNTVNPMQALIIKENQIKFTCHLKRGCHDFWEETSYEVVQFVGYFRSNIDSLESDGLISSGGYNSDCDSRLMFVCIGRIKTPQLIREITVVESSKSEFTSRHNLEWKFLFLDHRAPPIIGYLPFEVLGTSGYDYYHFDDLEKVVTCHESLMQKGEGTSCYRFLTKGQQWIWLQTRFYITYHQWNSKPEYVVSYHRVISFLDRVKSVQKDLKENVDNSNDNAHSQSDAMSIMSDSSQVNSSTSKYYHEPHDQPHSSMQCAEGKEDNLIASNMTSSSWPRVNRSSCTSSSIPSCSVRQRSRLRESTHNRPQSETSHSTGSVSTRHSTLTHYNSKSRSRMGSSHSHISHTTSKEMPHLMQTSSHSQLDMRLQTPMPQHGIGTQYLDPVPYIATLPIRPVLTANFPPPTTLSRLPPSNQVIQPAGIMITPAQVQIQEQLQKKHEELQQMIMNQQEELRRVSEQLVMARYGLLSPVINVSMSYAPPIAHIRPGQALTNALVPISVDHEMYPNEAAVSVQSQNLLHQSEETSRIQEVHELLPMQMTDRADLFLSPEGIEDSNINVNERQ